MSGVTSVRTVAGYQAPGLARDLAAGQQAGAGRQAALDLVMHLVAAFDACMGPSLVGLVGAGRPCANFAISPTRAVSNAGLTLSTTMNRLPAMQLWPPLTMRAAARDPGGRSDVGVLQHQIGVGAAQFEHALLQRRAGGGGDLAAGLDAAGQGDGGDMVAVDQGGDLAAGDQGGAEQVCRESRRRGTGPRSPGRSRARCWRA